MDGIAKRRTAGVVVLLMLIGLLGMMVGAVPAAASHLQGNQGQGQGHGCGFGNLGQNQGADCGQSTTTTTQPEDETPPVTQPEDETPPVTQPEERTTQRQNELTPTPLPFDVVGGPVVVEVLGLQVEPAAAAAVAPVTLPFTGIETGSMAGLAVSIFGAGLLLLAVSRKRELET